MAYNASVADRIRRCLGRRRALTERKMFGGISFLLGGRMCCGVIGDDLVIRVGPQGYQQAVGEPHARPMDFTGRPLRGFVYVAPAGYQSDKALMRWVQRAIAFVTTLPKKP